MGRIPYHCSGLVSVLWLVFLLFAQCHAFVLPSTMTRMHRGADQPSPFRDNVMVAASVSTSIPSQAECEDLGIREWPSQVKQGSWTETADADQTLTRYVLEGEGTLAVADNEDASKQSYTLTPGILVTVTGPAALSWQVKSTTSDMILLTPSYEEGGLLLAVAGFLLLLLGALFALPSL